MKSAPLTFSGSAYTASFTKILGPGDGDVPLSVEILEAVVAH